MKKVIFMLLGTLISLKASSQTTIFQPSGCTVGVSSGTLYDNGGSASNYSNNIGFLVGATMYFETQTYCPTVSGQSLSLTFTSFNTENGVDYVSVTNGASIFDPPFTTAPANINGSITGNQATPFTYTATNTSGCITIGMYTDGSVTKSGFAATISTVNNGFAQPYGNSDCANATFICDNTAFNDISNGPGLVPTEGCSAGGCLTGEVYSNWYSFAIKTSGTLTFSINPVNNNATTGDDYDFALFGPAYVCGSGADPIRCSFAAGKGTSTGLNGTAIDNSDGSGDALDGWVAQVNVTAGQTYYLLVNDFSAGGSGFNLNFGGTATLGTPEPTINSASVCGTQSTTLTASTIVAGGTYSWTPGGQTTASINVSPASTTNYTCTYTYLTCPSSVPGTATITVTNPPTAAISYAGTPFCTSNGTQAVTLSGTNNYTGGTFSSTGGLTINAASGLITPSSSTPNNYTVTYAIPADGPCPSTNTTTAIVVDGAPTASAGSIADVCSGATPTVVGASSSNGTISWTENGTGSITAGGTTSAPTYGPTSGDAGNTVTLTMSVASNNSCGNTVQSTASFLVNPIPTASISGTTAVCQNAGSPNVTFTGANGTAPYTFTYNINGGAGQTVSTTVGNSVTVAVPTGTVGSFAYNLVSVHDASSTACSQAQVGTATITVNPLPTATISGTTAVCQNASSPNITFTGANGTAPYTFTYNINGGAGQTVSTTVGNSVTVAVPTGTVGSFAYNLVSVQDASSTTCSQVQVGTATITVNPLPTATISGTTAVCQNAGSPNVTFTGANGTTPYTFTYNINGGASQTVSTTVGNSVTVAVPTGTVGSFAYNLVSVQDASSTTCSQVQVGTATITVNSLPSFTTIPTDPTTCNGTEGSIAVSNLTNSTNYNVTYSNGGPVVGPTAMSSDASGNILISNLSSGSYSLTIALVSTGCSTTQSGIVLNNTGAPTMVINDPSAVCTPNTVDLTLPAVTSGSAGGLTYTYWTDALATNSLASPNAVGVQGIYYIQGTSGACSVTLPVHVTINQLPNLVTNNPPSVCSPSTVDITLPAITIGSSNVGTLSYWTDNAATSSFATPTTAGNGTYYIQASNNGCTSIQPVTVTVVATPQVTGPVSSSSCDNINLPAITGNNLSGNAAYYFISGGTTTIYHVGDLVNSTVTLTIADSVGTCGSTLPVTFTINQTPVADAPSDVTACDNYILPALGVGNYYTGTGGTGSMLTAGTNISSSQMLYIYAESGTTPNCTDENSFNITINTTPTITGPITDPNGNCDTYILPAITGNNLSGNEAYYYNDGVNQAIYHAGDIVNATVTLTIADSIGACGSTMSFTVTIIHAPILDHINDITGCISVDLPTLTGSTITPNAAYYDASHANGGNLLPSTTLFNDQMIWVYDYNGSCVYEDSFNVVVNQFDATFTVVPEQCDGSLNPAIPTYGGGIFSFNPDPLDGAVIDANTGEISNSVGGSTYTIQYDVAGCPSEQQSVNIITTPSVPTAGFDTTYCIDAKKVAIEATALSGGKLTWYQNDLTHFIQFDKNSFAPYDSTNSYLITETSLTGGCESQPAIVTITVHDCSVNVPTAFTPDGDSMNDIWEIDNLDYNFPNNEVKIFNRWGNLVYKSDKGKYNDKPWDGKYNGENLPVASYYFTIDVNDETQKPIKGTVTIIRK